MNETFTGETQLSLSISNEHYLIVDYILSQSKRNENIDSICHKYLSSASIKKDSETYKIVSKYYNNSYFVYNLNK